MRRYFLLLIPLVLGLFLVTGCAVPSLGNSSLTADGTLQLSPPTGGDGYTLNGPCWGIHGYSDIHEGTEVIVSDASGTTVAVGALEQGKFQPTHETCIFNFHVHNVPAGKHFYKVEVSHRGGLQYTEDEIKNNVLHFSLG